MEIRATSDEGNPIVISQPDGPHAQHYMAIAEKVLNGLGAGQRAAPKIIVE
jgi:ATP-binding protein involved in chromosome partitioning